VGRVDGEYVINPTVSQMKLSDIDIMIAGTIKDIVMLEGEMKEISELEMVEVIKIAHQAIIEQCQFQLDLAALIPASSPKRVYSHETHNEDIKARVYDFCMDKCKEVARQGIASKVTRTELFGAIKEEFLATLTEEELAELKGFVSIY